VPIRKLAEEGEKTTRKNKPQRAKPTTKPHPINPDWLHLLSYAVQDGQIVREGAYSAIAVQGYRMGAKGDPRLQYFLK